MAYPLSDRHRVFLAFHTVFIGRKALYRKPKQVRVVVEKHGSFCKELMDELGFDGIVEIVILLLKAGIFQHHLKAQQAFPELSQVISSRGRQLDAPENNPANLGIKLLGAFKPPTY